MLAYIVLRQKKYFRILLNLKHIIHTSFSFTFLLNLFASVYFLMALSIDRYISICHPIQSKKIRTKRYVGIMATVTWLVSSIFSSSAFKYRILCHTSSSAAEIHPEEMSIDYFCMWSFKNVQESRYFLASKIFLGFFCPLLVIIGCYLAIVRAVRRSEKNMNKNSQSGLSLKAERVIVVVISVFFCTWLPNHVFNFVSLLSKEPSQTPLSTIINGTTVILASLNSCLNPILYAFLKPQMRMELWKLITRKKRSKNFIFSPEVHTRGDSVTVTQRDTLSTKHQLR